MDSLVPVVVGALLAAGAGFFGAWLQSRREHEKWLREKRYDAFVELRHILIELDDADRAQELAGMVGDIPGISRQVERRGVLEGRLRASVAELTFAPRSVQKAAAWFALQRTQTHNMKQREDAERALELAMRNAMKVRD